jgi:hypothetical protein
VVELNELSDRVSLLAAKRRALVQAEVYGLQTAVALDDVPRRIE